ncbi:hypothetical protein BP5796_09094 [Coleophoma crateriformis]|uniref:Uncharacterized protein n=1 Tax=Coleophoma crateriformis TaxID=565419 RepID=A0A3D8R325_9HELO|nr:hypothetical protein BP5796_09094 [Coleophoma crateriformis]
MAPLLEDPRFRQTWNQLSQNAESATETAAAGIWTFQHAYINPCFSSISSNLQQCTGHCFPDREERLRRRERGRTRGRAELSFDFYDDWDEDEGFGSAGLGGWGNDEFDRLLAGSGSHSAVNDAVDQAPRRKRGMSYGTRGNRRKSLDPDPTVIPSTTALGFLGRLPFRLGGTLRYKPSAADLQEHPGGLREEFQEDEAEPLMSDDHSADERNTKRHSRKRSSTASSGETTDSFRSRGDLFPSDGEDDAVPLSDEFAMALERRMTLTDDRSSGKTGSSKGKRSIHSRRLSRNASSGTQSLKHKQPSLGVKRASSHSLPSAVDTSVPDMIEAPSLTDLQLEEERIRMEEDAEVERKRQAAVRLAQERGLQVHEPDEGSETKTEAPVHEEAVPDATPQHEIEERQSSRPSQAPSTADSTDSGPHKEDFVPARLPHFG